MQKAMLRLLSEEVFVIKNIKNTVTRTYVISDLNSKGIVGTFYEKEFQKVFRVEKVIKKKGNKLCVGWEGYDSCFNSWIDKKDINLMSEYLPKPKSLGAHVKVELNLSNYATK